MTKDYEKNNTNSVDLGGRRIIKTKNNCIFAAIKLDE